jgi:hypothetical protein
LQPTNTNEKSMVSGALGAEAPMATVASSLSAAPAPAKQVASAAENIILEVLLLTAVPLVGS